MRMVKGSIIFMVLLLQFLPLSAQFPGTLDPSFGDTGVVLLDHNYNSQNNAILGSAIQADGKLVFGGWSYGPDASGYNFIRLMPDGEVDENFGIDGVVVINPGGTNDYISDVAIQQDGKILGIGNSNDMVYSKTVVIRLNPDGTLDNGFGINGIVDIDLGPLSNVFGFALFIQDDGKILTVGDISSLPEYEFIMCRLNPDGSFDHTFGDTGIIINGIPNKIDHINSIGIQNEKIIVGGTSYDENWNGSITIYQYLMDGILDTQFGNGGIAIRDIHTQLQLAEYSGKVCLSQDGKIIYAGYVNGIQDNHFAVLRFLSDGSIDNSFGDEGISVTEIDGDAKALGVVVQSDGKIIAGGYRAFDYNADFTLVRYMPNGDLDTSFGTNGTGIVIQNLSDSVSVMEDKIKTLALQTDGKLIAAGYAYTESGIIDFAAARYFADIGAVIESPHKSQFNFSTHPNPFTHKTTLEFTLDSRSDVAIEVYDNRGIRVGTIANQSFDQGEHQLRWNSDGMPAGVYIIKMTVGDMIYTKKVVKSP